VGWEWARGWEGTQPGQLTPTAYHTTLYSAMKAQGNGQDRGTFTMAFVFPRNCNARLRGE